MIDVAAYRDEAVVPGLGDVHYHSVDAIRDDGLPLLAGHLAGRGYAGTLHVYGPRGGRAMFYVPRDPRYGLTFVFGSRAIARRIETIWPSIRRNPARRARPWPWAVTEGSLGIETGAMEPGEVMMPTVFGSRWERAMVPQTRPGPVTAVRAFLRRHDRPTPPEFRRMYRTLGLAEAALFGALGPRGGVRRMTRAQEAAAYERLATDPRTYARARVMERLRRQLIRRYWGQNPRRPRRPRLEDVWSVGFAPGMVVVGDGLHNAGRHATVMRVGRRRLVLRDHLTGRIFADAPRWWRVENPWRHERVALPGAFDPRSFRTVTPRPDVRVTVGCPVGAWDVRRGRCRVGMRVQRVLRWRPNPGFEWHRERVRTWRDLYVADPTDPYTRGAYDEALEALRVELLSENPRLIYPRVDAIFATKTRGPSRGRYVHRFRTPVAALGEPDGTVRLVPR